MGLLEQLGLNGTFVMQIISFVILVILLNKVAYKPLMKILSERKQYIDEQIDSAEANRQSAEQLKVQLEADLKKARAEAHALLEQATKSAEKAKEEIMASAQAETAKEIQRAKEAIALEREQAIASLRGEVATLAVMAAGRVLDKTISVQDHEKLVNDFLAEVGDLKC